MQKRLTLLAVVLVVIALSLGVFTACSAEAKIDHIEIFASPKTSYYLGEDLDLTDSSILVVYVDNSERKVSVTSDMVSTFNPNIVGDQYIVIGYEGATVSFKVTVSRPPVQNVSLEIPDANVNYIEGQLLNLKDCYMHIYNTDGSNIVVPIVEDMCSGYDRNKLGAQEITVSYDLDGTTCKATYNVTVEERELSSIEIRKLPTTLSYFLGDGSVDLTGGVLILNYNSGYSDDVDMTSVDGAVLDGLTYSFNSDKTGSTQVTLTYKGFATDFSVTIVNRDVKSYELTNYNDAFKEEHPQYQEKDLNLDGLEISVTYTNGGTEVITYPSDKIKFSGYDKSVAGDQQVKIEFYYGTAKLSTEGMITVNVIAKAIKDLEMYECYDIYQDTAFDIGKWSYRVVYNNGTYGTTQHLSDKMIEWDGGVSVNRYSVPGKYSWHIVRDDDLFLDYDFEVKALRVTGVEFDIANGRDFLIAKQGGTPDFSDVTLNVTYNNGKTVKNVAIADGMLEFVVDTEALGIVKATSAIYKDAYETEGYAIPTDKIPSVKVIERIAKVEIKSSPKTEYVIGEEFELYGMRDGVVVDCLELNVWYEDAVTATVVRADEKVFGNEWTLVWEKEGKQIDDVATFEAVGTYTVSLVNDGYDGKVSLTITVTNNPTGIKGIYKKVWDGDAYEYEFRETLGIVVEGNAINLDDYYIALTYESVSDDYYDDDDFIQITSDMLDYESRDFQTGDREVKIYYPSKEGFSYSTIVSVISKSAQDIEVKKVPDRYYYVTRNNITFDYTGMVLWLRYNNGTYDVIDIEKSVNEGKLQFGGISNTLGEQDISITYNNGEVFTSSVKIEVISSTVQQMTWTKGVASASVPGGTVIDENTIGNLFIEFSGGTGSVRASEAKVDVTYSNGNKDNEVSFGGYIKNITVEDYDKNSSGMQAVKLVYDNGDGSNVYLTVNVTVGGRQVQSIEVEAVGSGNAFTVIQGGEIDVQNYIIIVTFNDGSKTKVPMKSEYINYSHTNVNGYKKSDTTEGTRDVTVTYTYGNEKIQKSVTKQFEVLAKKLLKIDVNDIPKRYYIEGEEFDITGGTVALYYDNGTVEIKNMTDAGDSDSSATFYIDKSNFNNSEFSGTTRTQRINISYRYAGEVKTTSYVIYMRDRRNVEVEYPSDDDYNYRFTYGDCDKAPSIKVMGYEEYGAAEREKEIAASEYTIEYIPQSIWLSVGRESGVDYTAFPKDAGTYCIVVSYVGDGIHNKLEDSERTIVIDKKKLYFSVVNGKKVYGEETPEVLIQIGLEKGEYLDDPLSAFVNGDELNSESFNSKYDVTYETKAYLAGKDGKKIDPAVVLDMFDIYYVVQNTTTVAIMDNTAAAGIYSIGVRNQIVGKNYTTEFINGTFTVKQRVVVVKPESVSYNYGDIAPKITFTTASKEGDSAGGLCNGESLKGALAKGDPTNSNVGEYDIAIGTLNSENPNYEIELDANGAKVTILPRTLYVKADSAIKVYGEEIGELGVGYYADSACSDEQNAFASNDGATKLGTVTFEWESESGWTSGLPDARTPVGKYKVRVAFDEVPASAKNYKINYINGVIEITERPVLVTAEKASKVYGDDDPEFKYTASAIPGNAASGLLEGDAFEGALGRVEGENYGDYAITVGTLGNANYAITFVSAKLSVLRKELYVKIDQDALTKTYDGKKPSIASYKLLTENGEAYAEVSEEKATEVRNYITLTFDNASKDVGTYKVRLSANNNNYSVSFVDGVEYTYVIQSRKVTITVADFVNLPDGEEYKNAYYEFSAHVNAEYLQPVYNEDGTQATDADNKPLYDDDSVTLSLSRAMNAGTYTTRVQDITNKNYELSDDSQEVTFTIEPRTIYVVVACNSQTEEYTIEREFNNQSANLTGKDYTLENVLDGVKAPNFALGIYSGTEIATARDVRYADDGVTIIGYDVRIAENSVDSNYVIALKHDYKYKIVPRSVRIRINDRYLSKTYDGEAPNITTAMFAPAEATTGFDNSTVTFVYERSGNDGRDNSNVGTYDVKVTCSDKNFEVGTYGNYIYTISKASVNVTINSSALAKAYDGNNFAILYENLTFGSYSGSTPVVHNFVYGTDHDEYKAFQTKLEAVTQQYSALQTAIDEVNFASNPKVKIEKAISELNSFRSLINRSDSNCFTSENTQKALAAASGAKDMLDAALQSLAESETDKAKIRFTNALNYIAAIKTVVEAENSYIVFEFGGENTVATADKGTYAVEMYATDYNRDFKLLNSYKIAEVRAHQLKVEVESAKVEYGTKVDDVKISYKIIDVSKGNAEVDSAIREIVDGAPKLVTEGDVAYLKAGSYSIDLSDMSVKNENYTLDTSAVAKLEVTKRALVIKMDDISDEEKFVYGSAIYRAYFDGYLGSYTYESGLADCDKLDGKTNAEILADIIVTSYATAHCYVSGDSGTEIFSATAFNAGEYVWTVSGLTSANYAITVNPGKLTVSKLAITAKVPVGNDKLVKTYGDTSVKFSYYVSNNKDVSSVLVYKNDDTEMRRGTKLSQMVWAYEYDESGKDPFAADTNVKDAESYEVKFNANDYYMQNYKIVFADFYTLVINPAPLTLTPKTTDKNKTNINAKYLSTPANEAYEYVYVGFRNEQTAASLGLIVGGDNAPTINFPATYDAGTYDLGASNVDMSKTIADVTNYTITVSDFKYEIVPRDLYVKLENVDTVLTDHNYDQATGQWVNVLPYTIEITATTKITVNNVDTYVPTSANLIRGNYGKGNFVFAYEEIEGDTDEIKTKLASLADSAKSQVTLFTNYVLTQGENGKNVEYYKGSELYEHSVNVIKDSYTESEDGNGYGTVKAVLKGMSLDSSVKNLQIAYEEFDVNVQVKPFAVLPSWSEKLIEGDKIDKSKLLFSLYYAESTNIGNKGVEVLNGTSDYVGFTWNDVDFVNNVGVTKFITAYYAYEKELFKKGNFSYSETYVTGTIATQVTDARTNIFSANDIEGLSQVLATRVYPKESAVTENPVWSDLTYGAVHTSTSNFIKTDSEHNYDTIRMSVRLAQDFGAEFSVILACNEDYMLTLTFNANVANSATIGIRNAEGEFLGTMSYAIDCATLFDGYTHDLRVMFDKELLSVIVAVDGNSGENENIGLMEDIAAVMTIVGQRGSYFGVDSSVDFVIGDLALTEQGLCEPSGTYVNLAASSSGTVWVHTTLNTYSETVKNITSYFGLKTELPDGYRAYYYVDGEEVNEEIELSRGSHLAEVALYYNGVLVGYDYTTIMVSAKLDVYVDDETNTYSDGYVLRTYTPVTNVDSSFTGDKDLITADASKSIEHLIVPSSSSVTYFHTKFILDRVAKYNSSAKTAIYEEGTYTLYYGLFAFDSEPGDVTEDGFNGVRMRFERTQKASENYSDGTNNYVYDVYLDYPDGTTQVAYSVKGTSDGVGAEITAYYDKLGMLGNGTLILRIRVGSGVETYNVIEVADTLTPYGMIIGNATRMTINALEYVERDHAHLDYLVGDVYSMYVGKEVDLTAKTALTLAGGNGSAEYSAYDKVYFEFTVPETETDGTVTMTIARSHIALENTYGAYLYYDIGNKKLYFKFGLDGYHSYAQEVALGDDFVTSGKHSISVYIGATRGASVNKQLAFGDTALTNYRSVVDEDGVAKDFNVYYRTIGVNIDDQPEVTFYMPFYKDIKGWLLDTGKYYGGANANNEYTSVGEDEYPPTFLARYNSSSVIADVDIVVNKYIIYTGETYAYSDKTEFPQKLSEEETANA